MSFKDFGSSRRFAESFQDSLGFGKAINEDDRFKPLPKSQRGVRPRLETRCPVTSKTLMDDMSVAETVFSQQSAGYSQTHEEEDPMIPPVSPSPLSSKRNTVFAQLTSEILNFQRMVTELESLLEVSGESPEAQWRSRILVRSAQDADRDICRKLYEYETGQSENLSNSRAQMASRKLHRDFRRVHKHLKSVLQAHQKRQQVEVSFLTSEHKTEDFFDRAMREREAEVNNIHESMQKVNDIYSDLAALVDSQQEQIDKIAETTEYSKTNTRAGLEQIQQSVWGLCGPTDVSTSPKNSQNNSKDIRMDEEFTWSIPFETFGEDIRAVHEDVLNFGRNLLGDIPSGFGCAPVGMTPVAKPPVNMARDEPIHISARVRRVRCA